MPGQMQLEERDFVIVVGRVPLFLQIIEQSEGINQRRVLGNNIEQRAKLLEMTGDGRGRGPHQCLGALQHVLCQLRDFPMRP